MSESRSLGHFAESFDELHALATDSTSDPVWYHFSSATELRRPSTEALAAPNDSFNAELWQLLGVYGAHPDYPQPAAGPNQRRYGYARYTHSLTRHPEAREEVHVDVRRLAASGSLAPCTTATALNVPNLCATYTTMAEDMTQLAFVARRLVDWGAKPPSDQEKERQNDLPLLERTVGRLVVRSMDLSNYQSAEAAAFADIFSDTANAGYSRAQDFSSSITIAFGRILKGVRTSGIQAPHIKSLDQATVARALEAFDRRQLIQGAFWPKMILKGYLAKSPELSQPLLRHLMADRRSQCFLADNAFGERLALRFMADVLGAYAQDELRQSERSLELSSQINGGPYRERRVRAYRAAAEYTPDESQAGDVSQRDLNEIFLQLMAATVSPARSIVQRAHQFEQDVTNADIVAALCRDPVRGRSVDEAELGAYFPELPPDALQEVEMLIQTGVPAYRAIYAS